MNLALTDRVVIPAYRQMAGAMDRLQHASVRFCEAEASWRDVTRAFDAAMDAWQAAQPIAFGPVTWEARNARIQFWPDKRGTGGRQVERALEARDPALTEPNGLVGKSVALQSLATYERLLYGMGEGFAVDTADARSRYACALAAAIARFQATLAAEVLADWSEPDGFRAAVTTAAQGNRHYQSDDEVAADFLKSLSGTLDLATKLKLDRPLGDSLERARPRRAESWRSGRSLANLIANLETAQALYGLPGGFGDLLAATGAEALDSGIRKSFLEALAAARAITGPLRETVTDPTRREGIANLRERLRSLHLLIAGPMAQEIGLIVGFNALDGD